MSNRNLSQQQFFHVSNADLKPGDELQPASKVGSPYGDDFYVGDHEWRQHRVWMAPTPKDAGTWHIGTKDVSHVYEVEPHDVVKHNPHEDWDNDEPQFHAAKAVVKRRVAREEWT